MHDHYQFRKIKANQIHLHVLETGPAGGPPVILLHGFPEFWYGWRDQIPALAEAGYGVIVPDQRGYNESEKPAGISAYRMDVLARDVTGLMDALGLQRAALVGHDWGGVIAWVTAALYPDRVEKLAVINAPYPTVPFKTIGRHPEQLLKSSYMYFFQLPFLAEAVLRGDNWKMLAEGMRRSSLPGTFTEADFDLYRQAWWRKDAMTSMLNWYRAFVRRPAGLPQQPHFPMPVKILWGRKDFALGPELAQASLDLCQDGELIFFDEQTHWVQHEAVERVNAELLSFLEK